MKKIYVVGIGPGAQDDMTFRAYKTLESADVIAGYEVYIELIRPLFPHKDGDFDEGCRKGCGARRSG